MLKKLRKILSLLFFLLTLIVFLDFSNSVPQSLRDGVLFLQFVPSLLKFTSILGVASSGFIVVILLTLLFGRIYCSVVCPLGILQDIIAWFSKKLGKKLPYKYLRPANVLKYTVLAVTGVLMIAGSIFLLIQLDPFGIFGRMATQLIKPLYIMSNNLVAGFLAKYDNYSLYHVDYKGFHRFTFVYSLSFLGLIFWFAFYKGRLYCNSICPVGTLLGLVSKASLIRIKLDKDSCTSCGLCEKICKSGCIDTVQKKVDISRCVDCYNCLKICPQDAIKYGIVPILKDKAGCTGVDREKREFINKTIIGIAGLTGLSRLATAKNNGNRTIPALSESTVVSPPGSQSISHLNKTCIACHLCVSSCPTRVLQPSFLEYGFLYIMQPRMDFRTNFCNYECTVCSEVCPSGAILPFKPGEKLTVQTGVAKFIKARCVVETEGTDCGACSEHCPTKAVKMVPYGNVFLPDVDEKICVGCGACEYACPVEPLRAIYIDGHSVHQTAQKPETVKQDREDASDDDFPF
ncbi:MAG: 4Fe-4S binding protein [Bacteroidetes bacterium]|nr:4Fe-4S binding protein [Bacteroidota bacterium]